MHEHLSAPFATSSLCDPFVCQRGQNVSRVTRDLQINRGRNKKARSAFPRKLGKETGSEESGWGNNKVSFDH